MLPEPPATAVVGPTPGTGFLDAGEGPEGGGLNRKWRNRHVTQRYATPPLSFARYRPTTLHPDDQPASHRKDREQQTPRRTHERPTEPRSNHASKHEDSDSERGSQSQPCEPAGIDESSRPAEADDE